VSSHFSPRYTLGACSDHCTAYPPLARLRRATAGPFRLIAPASVHALFTTDTDASRALTTRADRCDVQRRCTAIARRCCSADIFPDSHNCSHTLLSYDLCSSATAQHYKREHLHPPLRCLCVVLRRDSVCSLSLLLALVFLPRRALRIRLWRQGCYCLQRGCALSLLSSSRWPLSLPWLKGTTRLTQTLQLSLRLPTLCKRCVLNALALHVADQLHRNRCKTRMMSSSSILCFR
jgi:hypothetical protein